MQSELLGSRLITSEEAFVKTKFSQVYFFIRVLIIDTFYTILTMCQVAIWLGDDCNKCLVHSVISVEATFIQYVVLQYLFNDLFGVETRVFYGVVQCQFMTV